MFHFPSILVKFDHGTPVGSPSETKTKGPMCSEPAGTGVSPNRRKVFLFFASNRLIIMHDDLIVHPAKAEFSNSFIRKASEIAARTEAHLFNFILHFSM